MNTFRTVLRLQAASVAFFASFATGVQAQGVVLNCEAGVQLTFQSDAQLLAYKDRICRVASAALKYGTATAARTSWMSQLVVVVNETTPLHAALVRSGNQLHIELGREVLAKAPGDAFEFVVAHEFAHGLRAHLAEYFQPENADLTGPGAVVGGAASAGAVIYIFRRGLEGMRAGAAWRRCPCW